MEIIITQGALDSYLELRAENAFTDDEYWNELRPDVMLLQKFPNHPKFKQGKFWSSAQDRSGGVIADGYKMKWHQIGNGRVQMRLTVGIFGNPCILCEAYIKKDDKLDKRKLARFKGCLELIRQGSYTVRGELS